MTGRMTGLKSMMLAAGLMLGCMTQANAQAGAQPQAAQAQQSAQQQPAQKPVVAKVETNAAAANAGVTVSAPGGATPAAATGAAAPTAAVDPVLSLDGGPDVRPVAGIGQPVDGHVGVQPQFTPNGRFAAWMHDSILVPVITAISVFVLLLLLYAMWRYRRAANPVASKTSHNTLIEVVWTLLPVVILVMIAVPSIGLLQAQFKPAPANAVTLKAIGNQWYWSYQYPDHGGFEITANLLKEKDAVAAGERARTDADGPRLLATDNRVVLPVGVPIRLLTTSNDVIHSWAMPAFWIKLDAVPGKINETSFTIEKPGVYFGQCSELCGPRHGYMPIAVVAVEPAVFARWVAAKGGQMPGAAPAPAAAAPATQQAPATAPAQVPAPTTAAAPAAATADK